MLGSALNAVTARGLIGRKVEIVKARERGAVTAKVTGVVTTGSPTDIKPLLLKGVAKRPDGTYDHEASYVAIWPKSQINVLA